MGTSPGMPAPEHPGSVSVAPTKAAFTTSRVGVAIAASWAQATEAKWRPS
jgi:hypothetical protein